MNSIDYDIVYIGSLSVTTSMRSLNHRSRSEVAKESIKRLCSATSANGQYERKQDECIDQMLGPEPNLKFSGTKVRLSVTSTHLNVIERDTDKIIIQHEMPNVSFASGGDDYAPDYVAYVAKDAKTSRSCFVLKCGHQTAHKVLDRIAKGFSERSQQLLCSNGTMSKELWFHGSISEEESDTRLHQAGDFLVREENGHYHLRIRNSDRSIVNIHLNEMRTRNNIEFNSISELIQFLLRDGVSIRTANNDVVHLIKGVIEISS